MTEQNIPAEETRPDRRYVPWYRRLVPNRRTAAVVVLALVALPFGVRWYHLSQLPDVPMPFDVEAFNEPLLIGMGHEQHAFTHFQKGLMVHTPMPNAVSFSEKFSEPTSPAVWDEYPEDVRQWVVQSQPVIEHFRRGGRCETGQYILPKDYNFMVLLPYHQGVRDLQRLSNLNVIRLLHDGNTREAIEELHDTYRAHRFLGERGCFIERLIGVACHSVHSRQFHFWCRHPQVTAEDLDAALARLRQDWKMTRSPSENFQVEYSSIVNELKLPMTNLLSEFDQALDRWAIQRTGMSTAPLVSQLSSKIPGWQVPFLWIAGEPERSRRGARLWLTHCLKTCDLPRRDQPPALPILGLPDTDHRTAGLTAKQLSDRLETTLLPSVLPAAEQVLRATWAEAGRQAMLELEMELQILIRRQHLQSRQALETALENYAWPIDPAASDGSPIRHRFTDDGLKLWSLSWDGKDQDGSTENKGQGIDSVVVIPWPVPENPQSPTSESPEINE